MDPIQILNLPDTFVMTSFKNLLTKISVTDQNAILVKENCFDDLSEFAKLLDAKVEQM